MLSVLLIGPEIAGMPALQVQTELLRIGDIPGVNLVPLVGKDVTLARLLDRLDRQRYDVLLWSGHGTASVLMLSDCVVSPYALAVQVVRHGISLVVLSACNSAMRPEAPALSLGFQDVLPSHGITMVAMAQDVPDLVAVEYDVAFVRALEAGATVREAHSAGLEAAALAGNAAAPQLFVADSTSMNETTLMADTQLLRSMNDKIDKVGEQVGDIKTRQALLEADLKRLVDDVRDLRQQMIDLRKGTYSAPRAYIGVMLALGIAMMIVLMVVMWRIL